MRAPATVVVIVLSAVLALGCRQGEGERCQTTADCEDGLQCVESTHTCLVSEPSTGNDGGTDAPNDAAIDAAVSTVDAVSVDAP